MTASEKVAYLKGLAEGLGISENSGEGKLLLAMIEVIDSLAADIEDLETNMADMADSIDGLSDDIAYVEDLALGDDMDDEDGDDEGCDGNCCGCSGCGDDAEFEVTCPTCGEVMGIYEEDIDFGSIICTSCGEELEFEFDEDDEAEGAESEKE